MPLVEEPLLESAPLAWEWAPRLCWKDAATGIDCSAIHGIWQYLRLMGLVTAPEHHAEFFRSAFDAVTATAPRVLVSGAVDYSMLAHALAIFRERGVEARISMIDRCETPLRLSLWYADRAGCRVESRRCDMAEYAGAETYDLICTHSFLGQFSPDRRPDVIRNWYTLLRPGGLVVTVNRLRPAGAGARARFEATHGATFRAVVLRGAEALPAALRPDLLELARKADMYAGSVGGWPIRSLEEIRVLFSDAGFEVQRLVSAPVASDPATPIGPTMPRGAEYAQVVARRP
jgi:SAM-dependent methyltransferase